MNLKELRLKRHLTQKELAEKTNLALITIQKLEQGKMNPSIDSVEKLSSALNYSFKVILNAIKKSQQ